MHNPATHDDVPMDESAAPPTSASGRRVLPLVAVGLSLFGAIFVTIGVFALKSSQILMAEGVTAPGVVTRLEQRSSTSGSGSNRRTSSSFYPWFRFTDAAGQTHEIASNMGTNPPSHSIGEAVTVRYLPAQPQEAVIDSWTSLWLFPTIFIGVGCLPEIAAVILIVVWLRKGQSTLSPAVVRPAIAASQPVVAGADHPRHSSLHERLERSRA